uniref:RIB43A-like with coiled-coils protein 1 n=1 Tax=Lygus hesperus TaxID=30085 RepID=A0A0A9W4I3_LYGHE
MQPLMTPQDYKEAAKRERHKQIEEERRKRIFNAKQRLIGIDFEALERQIQEKKERERQEAIEDELWTKKQAQDMMVINAREKPLQEDRQRAIKELNEYRCQFQKWEDRREFDLNDPVSYYTPLNIDPNDQRFGISSLTRFEGQEDYPGSRQKIQLDQQHSWLEQQMIERKQQKCAQKVAEKALEQAEIAEGMRYRALKDLEDQCRQEQIKKTADFNKALAVKKMQQQFEEMKREIEDVTTHKMNTLTSDMLTENREAAESGLGPGRVNAANYKGMSEAEKTEIKRIQLEQIQENKDRKRKEELEELSWIEFQKNLQQSVRFIDMRLAAESKKRDESTRQVNKNLMEEQKAHRDYLEKYVYTNSCSDEYFKQFNTSTR